MALGKLFKLFVYKVPHLQQKYCKGNSELVHLIQISSQYILIIILCFEYVIHKYP